MLLQIALYETRTQERFIFFVATENSNRENIRLCLVLRDKLPPNILDFLHNWQKRAKMFRNQGAFSRA